MIKQKKRQLNTLFLTSTIICIVSIFYSIFMTISFLNYKEEYNRVQDELVELAIEKHELEEKLIVETETNGALLMEISDLKTEPTIKYQVYSVPIGHTSFRSWMPYTAISETSTQGKLLNMASPDNNGLMKIKDCYCVALGTYYGSLGDTFQVTTDAGTSFRVIKTDVKADQHTDSLHQYTTSNSCMMEFIVDKTTLNPSIKSSGSVNTDIISGSIIKIEKEGY